MDGQKNKWTGLVFSGCWVSSVHCFRSTFHSPYLILSQRSDLCQMHHLDSLSTVFGLGLPNGRPRQDHRARRGEMLGYLGGRGCIPPLVALVPGSHPSRAAPDHSLGPVAFLSFVPSGPGRKGSLVL